MPDPKAWNIQISSCPLSKVRPPAQKGKSSTVTGNGVARHLKQDTLVLFFEFSEVFSNMDIQYVWWDLLLRLSEGKEANLPKCKNIRDNIWPALFRPELLPGGPTSSECCRKVGCYLPSLQCCAIVPCHSECLVWFFWQNTLEIFLVP